MILAAMSLLAAVIPLGGVTGENLTVQAELDSCNVRLGDPMSVSLSFYAPVGFDFKALRPPVLAPSVDGQDWRLDKESAKTETRYIVQNNENTACGRTFTYGIRPLQEGVVTFPALEFSYTSESSDEPVVLKTGPIPVHVRPALQVALVETESAERESPKPDGLLVDLSASPWGSAEGLTDDELFAWRKACANPSAGAFAPFDFPEARLNEAACEILADNWARALEIYSSLEWRIGQTPAIERGIVAALAVKTQSPVVELPVWRQILRPVLRFALWGRVTVVAAGLLLLVGLIWAVRKGIRAVACLAVLLLPAASLAASPFDDPFAEMDRQLQQIHRQMNAAFGPGFGGGMSFGGFPSGGMRMSINGQEAPKVEVRAKVSVAKPEQTACVPFEVILELESPKNCTMEGLRFSSSQRVGFSIVGGGQALTDGVPSNPSNVVRRIAIPIRYDAPFKGRVAFEVSGQWTCQIRQDNGRGGIWSSSFSEPFRTKAPPLVLDVSLPEKDRPADFSGAVGAGFRLSQVADRTEVRTNDVVTLSCRLDYRGFLPADLDLGGRFMADEWGRTWIEFKRYFVADGAATTDGLALSYYDAAQQKYKTVDCPGVSLTYVPDDEGDAGAVVVNAEGALAKELVPLLFAPSEASEVIGRIDPAAEGLVISETVGPWVRVDDGRRAGWVKKEDLP